MNCERMSEQKREIVGSIFPENLTFDGEQYRTARINEAVRQIYLIEKELDKKKNGTIKGNFDLCRSADRTGLEPATSAVTGRHSNQLNYRSNLRFRRVLWRFSPRHPSFFGMAKIGEF